MLGTWRGFLDCQQLSYGWFIAGIEWSGIGGGALEEERRGPGGDKRRTGKNEFEELTLYYVMFGDLGGWFISRVWKIHYHWMVLDENFLRKQDKIAWRREWVWERQTSNGENLGELIILWVARTRGRRNLKLVLFAWRGILDCQRLSYGWFIAGIEWSWIGWENMGGCYEF